MSDSKSQNIATFWNASQPFWTNIMGQWPTSWEVLVKSENATKRFWCFPV